MVKRRSKHGATRLGEDKTISKNQIYLLVSLLLIPMLSSVVYVYRDRIDFGEYPINTIRIESQIQQVSEEEIREIVSLYAEAGFFGLKVDRIRNDLQQLSWVDHAIVRRQWPDKVVIKLIEHHPIAFWGDKGMVSETGEVFYPELRTTQYSSLPVFIGPEGTAQKMSTNYLEMSREASEIGQKIVLLEMSERRAWKMELMNGLRLKLGREDVTARFKRLKDVYQTTVARFLDAIVQVDLRYTNGFAIRWQEGARPVITG